MVVLPIPPYCYTQSSTAATANLSKLRLEDCYFRMMAVHEIGWGCGFDVDVVDHVVWGSARNPDRRLRQRFGTFQNQRLHFRDQRSINGKLAYQQYAVFESCCPQNGLTTMTGSRWIGSVLCSTLARGQTAMVPPSTTNSIPLTKLESFEARNNASVSNS